MSGTVPGRPVEFEVVAVAVGAGLVSGALALADATLAPLTGALAALALAGWVSARVGPRRAPNPAFRTGAPLVALGLGAVLFFAAPAPFVPARALLLALAGIPLWWTAPRRVVS